MLLQISVPASTCPKPGVTDAIITNRIRSNGTSLFILPPCRVLVDYSTSRSTWRQLIPFKPATLTSMTMVSALDAETEEEEREG
jgi:hypothetical protein